MYGRSEGHVHNRQEYVHIARSALNWRRRIPSASFFCRRYDRAKIIDPRFLLTSMTMIKGMDHLRHYRIVSALSLPSHRATGGLRRPSESQASAPMVAFLHWLVVSAYQPPQTNAAFRCQLGIDATTSRGSKGHVHSRWNSRNTYIRLT